MNDGEWDQVTDGIRVFGAGLREGHQGLQSVETFDFTNSETFIKWMAVGGNLDEYAAFWPFLISDYDPETYASTSAARGGFFTTDHQYKESTVIQGNTWFFTRIAVDAEGIYNAVTSTINYDSEGGEPFREDSGTYEGAQSGSVLVIFNDNYGGTYTHVVLGEAIVRHTE